MSQSTSEPSGPADQHGHTAELAAEGLLREYPNALVCGLADNGLIVPVPQSVALWGQPTIEGRALIDKVMTADRKTVIDVWWGALRHGRANGRVRLLEKPSRWMRLHFLDLREHHGVLLGIVVAADHATDEDVCAAEPPPAASPFCTLLEDQTGAVLDCDDAFTEMFGYRAEELIGKPALEQIHPEDHARTIEGWLTLLHTHRPQRVRVRRMHKDGGCIWTDVTLHNYLNQPDRKHVLVEIVDVSAEMAAWEALHT